MNLKFKDLFMKENNSEFDKNLYIEWLEDKLVDVLSSESDLDIFNDNENFLEMETLTINNHKDVLKLMKYLDQHDCFEFWYPKFIDQEVMNHVNNSFGKDCLTRTKIGYHFKKK